MMAQQNHLINCEYLILDNDRIFSRHLKRVRVPNFRVLKDVDITFEPNLVPRIFPLGSANGGGKSTLLQLMN
jgi:ABC-type Mn2+/Zn2+ transport system ATPase subunit